MFNLLNSAEIYDPRANSWPLFSMNDARMEDFVVPGGHVAHETDTNSTDLFDPETGTWAPAGLMNATRTGHFAIVLRGNRGILVMGVLTNRPRLQIVWISSSCVAARN